MLDQLVVIIKQPVTRRTRDVLGSQSRYLAYKTQIGGLVHDRGGDDGLLGDVDVGVVGGLLGVVAVVLGVVELEVVLAQFEGRAELALDAAAVADLRLGAQPGVDGQLCT